MRTAVFLSALIFVELLAGWLLPNVRIPILKSKNLHIIVALSLAFAFRGFGIVVTQRDFLVRHEDVYIAGLAPKLDGFSIGLVTDVHVDLTVDRHRVETIVKVMHELNADIVMVVGDFVDDFVSNLGQRAKPFRHFSLSSNLNLTVLRNAHKVIRLSSIASTDDESNKRALVYVVGVDDIVTEHLIKGHAMNIEKAITGCPPQSAIVMLAHQPNAARQIIDKAKRQIHFIIG